MIACCMQTGKWVVGYDGMILTSQNCGPYGPIVHPHVICDVDHGMTILAEANSQLVYQSALADTDTLRRSSHARHLWCEWESGRRKWEFSLSVPVGLQEILYMPRNLTTWDLRLYVELQSCRWILRFSRRRVWGWKSSGMLLRVFITLMMDIISFSKTSVSICHTAWCNIPEGNERQRSFFRLQFEQILCNTSIINFIKIYFNSIFFPIFALFL
jgi:hypothetical protein